MAMMSNWGMLSIRSETLAIFLMDDCPHSVSTTAHPPGAPSIPATHDTALTSPTLNSDCLDATPDNALSLGVAS